MLSNSKTTRLVAAAVGLTMAFTMIVGVGVSAVGAQGMTLAQLVDLLIATGVISPDKAAAARAAVAGTTTTTTTTTGGYTFAKDLQVGSRGADVTALQQMIGISPATGYFGALTKAAVVKFQKDNGINATGYVGPMTRSALNKVGGTTTTTTTGGTTTVVPAGSTMAVSLSATSPASAAVVAGQAIANLAEYNFVNSSDVAAVVTNVTLNRTGVSDDTTLSNVYLFDGASRVTDAATVSSGKITFNAGSGLFTIPARTAKTISVKADIKASTNGQIVGVSLTGVSANVPVAATFPINGATFTVAQGTMAGLSFNTTTSPAADNASLDPQNDFVMWENTASVTTRDIYLKTLSLKMIGSVAASDLGNFRLFVDGIMVATLSSVDANNYLTFNLSGSPVKLATGNRVIKVLGDVIGGSNKTFSFHLRQVSDVNAIDSQLNQPVLATANSTTFSDRTTGTQTIGVGSLTITKKADSPSGNITLGASNAVLGRFELKAAGEPVKIENLRIGAVVTNNATTTSLRNGSLYLDGVQVGSTQTIATTTGTTQYTEFSLGSSVIVTPGTTKILEVKADIYDNDGTDSLYSGAGITIRILAGSSNVLRMNALSYTTNALTDGNALTVSVGAMSLSKYASYGNQTTVVPQNNGYKIGSFVLTSSNGSEAINLNTLAVGIRANATTDGLVADMSNIYVKYGSNLSLVTPTKTTVSATSTWTINTSLAAGESMPIEIWSNLGSNMKAASTTVTYVKIDGQTVGSSQSKSAEALGQIITVQAGDISAASVNDTSVATRLVVGGNTVKVASYRITSLYDSYTIKNVAVKTTETTNAPAAISAVVFKNNGVQLGNQITVDSVSGIATSSDISLSVPANDPNGKVIDVYAVLNSVGPGAATTTANVALSLEGFKYETSGGTPGEYATDKTSNAVYVVKSIPTLANMLSEGTLTSGTSKTIASFKVTADAAGQVNWKKIQFSVNKTAAVTIGATSTMKLYDSNHNEVAGVFSTTTGSLVGGNDALVNLTSGTITFVATNEQEVTNSATYTLETTIGGIATGYNYVNVNIPVAATAIATPHTYSTLAGATGSFIWSDRSSVSGSVHSETTPDWLNDYKVLGVPTNSATLSVTI